MKKQLKGILFLLVMISSLTGWSMAQTADDNAAFVSQSVPATISSGQTVNVSVVMTNNGTTTWATNTAGLTSYFLSSQNPLGNTSLGINLVPLPQQSVAPGQTVTFNFQITAPSVNASTVYNFQWQMVRQTVGVSNPFGAITPNVPITVFPAGSVNITGTVIDTLSHVPVANAQVSVEIDGGFLSSYATTPISTQSSLIPSLSPIIWGQSVIVNTDSNGNYTTMLQLPNFIPSTYMYAKILVATSGQPLYGSQVGTVSLSTTNATSGAVPTYTLNFSLSSVSNGAFVSGVVKDADSGEFLPAQDVLVLCGSQYNYLPVDNHGEFFGVVPLSGSTQTCSVIPGSSSGYLGLNGITYQPFNQSVQLASGGSTQINIELLRNQTQTAIEGVLTDAVTGQPVPFAEVSLSQQEGVVDYSYVQTNTTTDIFGHYVLPVATSYPATLNYLLLYTYGAIATQEGESPYLQQQINLSNNIVAGDIVEENISLSKNPGYSGGNCAALPINTTACPGTPPSTTNGTVYAIVNNCANTPCTATCNSGYVLSNGSCVAASLPAVPTGLTATAGNSDVALSWNASANAATYTVYRSTSDGGPYTAITVPPTNGTSYTDSAVQNGTTYYYVVAANANFTQSGYSNQASATPTGSVSPSPSGTTIPSATQIIDSKGVVWTIVGGKSYENGVADGGSSINLLLYYNGTIYADTTSGWYSHATGSWRPISGDPRPGVLLAPQGLSVIGSSNQVILAWLPSAGATSYNVGRSTVSGGPYPIIAQQISGLIFTDETVTNGTKYYYVVNAQNASGQQSANSSEIGITPNGVTPTAPTGLTASVTNGQLVVVLQWNASTSASTYTVYRSTTNGGPYTAITVPPINGTIYADTSVQSGTTYYYVVTANANFTQSGYSNQASATPTAVTLPAPTNLTANAGNDQVTLYWSASPNATTYTVYRSTTNGGPYTAITVPPINALSYIDNAVQNGTTYYYVVAANANAIQSGYSNQASTVPTTAVCNANTACDITNGSGQYCRSFNSGAYNWVSPLYCTASIVGETYSCGGTTGTCICTGSTCQWTLPPAAPTGLSAVAGSSQVVLTWNASANAATYTVYRSTSNGGSYTAITVPPTNGTSYTDSAVQNGTTYYYVVTANANYAQSEYSNQASATPTGSVSPSPSGTTIPSATQIIDSKGVVWTIVSGRSYENGVADGGSSITLLLYYNGTIYADTASGWYSHATGGWRPISGDPRPAANASPNGTTIPSATQIIDSRGVVWTVVSGGSYENGVADGGSSITLLLYYNGSIYADTTVYGWWSYASGSWRSIPSDPRQPVSTIVNAGRLTI